MQHATPHKHLFYLQDGFLVEKADWGLYGFPPLLFLLLGCLHLLLPSSLQTNFQSSPCPGRQREAGNDGETVQFDRHEAADKMFLDYGSKRQGVCCIVLVRASLSELLGIKYTPGSTVHTRKEAPTHTHTHTVTVYI